jgi:hypothetical protein
MKSEYAFERRDISHFSEDGEDKRQVDRKRGDCKASEKSWLRGLCSLIGLLNPILCWTEIVS